MKVIPTFYNGILYRSRTEARWAKFFDLAGYKFRYENEGYDLPSGYYLPDFTLFDDSGNILAFAEVKGAPFTIAERIKTDELAKVTGQMVFELVGSPDFKSYHVRWYLNGSRNHQAVIFCGIESKYFPFFYGEGGVDGDRYTDNSAHSIKFEYENTFKAKQAIHSANNERFGVYEN